MADDSSERRYGVRGSTVAEEAIITLFDSAAEVEASFYPRLGGQLIGFRQRGQEILYRGQQVADAPEGEWSGRAPVLFPAVGRQADGKYCFPAGVPARQMPLHGFAARMPFEVEHIEADESAAWVRMTAAASCDAVKEAVGLDLASVYPFDFKLAIEYRLAEGRLVAKHTIAHRAPDTLESDASSSCSTSVDGAAVACKWADPVMPAAIGNHITFAFPFAEVASAGAMSSATDEGAASGSVSSAVDAWASGMLLGTTSKELHLRPGSLLAGTASPVPELQAGAAGLPLTAPIATNGVLALPEVTVSERAHARCTMRLEQPGVLAVQLEQWVSPVRRTCTGSCVSGTTGAEAAVLPHQAPCNCCCSPAAPTSVGHARCTWEEMSAERLFVLWGQPPTRGDGTTAAKPGFICVEPWLTGPDSLNTRVGLPQLLPGEEIDWSFSVQTFSLA